MVFEEWELGMRWIEWKQGVLNGIWRWRLVGIGKDLEGVRGECGICKCSKLEEK